MNEDFELPLSISVQTLAKIGTLLSHYLVPEHNALFTGFKKLVEQAYAPNDSSLPLVILNNET